MTIIAGTGVNGFNGDNQLATLTHLSYPRSVFKYKNEIYLAEDNRILKILQNGMIVTICGTYDEFICSIFVYKDEVYFTLRSSNRIRKVCQDGSIADIAGTGLTHYNGENIPAIQANMNVPMRLFVNDDGLIFCDTFNNRIRRVDWNGMISTIAGCGKFGFGGDVPFDFKQYPHGRWKHFIPFSDRYSDVMIQCCQQEEEEDYQPIRKKVKQ